MSRNISYYYRKVKSISPHILARVIIRKVLNEGKTELDKIRCKLRRTEISDKEFLKSVDNENFGITTLTDLSNHFRQRNYPRSSLNPSRKEETLKILRECFPDSFKVIIKQTDLICEHIFDLLGSGPVKVHCGMKAKGFENHYYHTQISGKKLTAIHHYEPIDWHIDFKSGYRWNPKTYYKDIKYGHRLRVDVKVPWELSRFQHLTRLAEAYFVSRDEKYVKKFVNQVTDWIEHNPPKFGVNWVCTMDVAIRACNWLLAWQFFKDSPLISNEFTIKFFKSLLQHGRHIENNLEYGEALTSNHYLSNLVGLLYLGVLIPEFKESKKWKNLGMGHLKKEMKKQVYPDGVDFEASTCYHRLVLELFFYATFLVIINDKNFKEDNFVEVGNEIFSEEYLQRLYKMFEFVLYALKPNGRMPQIGDNDNGRLHIFTKRDILDMRYLLTLGPIFFKEPKFKVKEFGFCEEALWVFGEESYKIWQDLKENSLVNIGSKAFPNAGWYIMRNDKNYCIISCGPNGQNGNGGHCHNDKLSFELCIDGQDVIVDPGTYVYTSDPEARNRLRGTACHNTVVVDSKEQNSFNRKNLFHMEDNAMVKCLRWKMGDEIDIFIGEHSGYARFSHPVIHKREIRYHKRDKKYEIIDSFKGEGKHDLEWNLILSPEFKGNLSLISDKLQWHREPAFYSSEYGIIARTEKLTSTLKATIPVEVRFWIKSDRK